MGAVDLNLDWGSFRMREAEAEHLRMVEVVVERMAIMVDGCG